MNVVSIGLLAREIVFHNGRVWTQVGSTATDVAAGLLHSEATYSSIEVASSAVELEVGRRRAVRRQARSIVSADRAFERVIGSDEVRARLTAATREHELLQRQLESARVELRSSVVIVGGECLAELPVLQSVIPDYRNRVVVAIDERQDQGGAAVNPSQLPSLVFRVSGKGFSSSEVPPDDVSGAAEVVLQTSNGESSEVLLRQSPRSGAESTAPWRSVTMGIARFVALGGQDDLVPNLCKAFSLERIETIGATSGSGDSPGL